MVFKALLLLAFVAIASAADIQIKPCPGTIPMPEFFQSDLCSVSTNTCTFTRGRVFTGRAGFTPKEVFTNLFVEMKAFLYGLQIPSEVAPGYENACGFLEDGATCPIGPGRQYVWAIQLPISASYPAARGVTIQLSAGEGGRTVACGMIDGDVV